jgi:uncharacterized membrane protein
MNSESSSFNNQSLSPNASGAWLRWVPFCLLLLVAVMLLVLWNQLPDRWPVHWGLNGQPDKWMNKSLPAVFLPVGIGVGLCLLFELLNLIILKNPQLGKNKNVAPEAAHAIAGRMVEFLRLIEIAVALVLSALAIMLPLLRPARPFGFVAFAFGVFIVAVGVGVWRLVQLARELKTSGKFAGLEGWNGLTYRNPNDPRLWVPRITGIGYTLNFAHRRAWPLFILFITLPLVIVAVIVLIMRLS